MKLEQKHKARSLRREGKSITRIAETLDVSKGSVSSWVRDVKLSDTIQQRIRKRSHAAHVVEKRRLSRLETESHKRQQAIEFARVNVRKLSQEDLFLVGISLYWGEGSKRKRGVLEFTNSDPHMIRVMMRFFSELQQVPPHKFRGHAYVHSHINPEQAEQYWANVSGIPSSQFHKTSVQKNKKRLQKDTLPYGTFAIVVCDTKKKLQMDGWIKGMTDRLLE